jgi:hypothetical protein
MEGFIFPILYDGKTEEGRGRGEIDANLWMKTGDCVRTFNVRTFKVER